MAEDAFDPAKSAPQLGAVAERNRMSTAKTQDASGLGAKVKAVRPLRRSDESASAYADRVAAWQTEQDKAQVAGQLKALKALPQK